LKVRYFFIGIFILFISIYTQYECIEMTNDLKGLSGYYVVNTEMRLIIEDPNSTD